METHRKQLLDIDIVNLYNRCLYDPTINDICNDDTFWEQKILQTLPEYHAGKREYPTISWRDYYLSLYRNQLKTLPVLVDNISHGAIVI